jgi:hypothetical protein
MSVSVVAPTRISAVLGIHQGLGILFPTEQLGVEWLRTPHNAVVFGGRPPLDLVTSGSQDGLLLVRRFLDGARGGLYMQPNIIDEAFRLKTTRKLSSGDGRFRTLATACSSPHPVAIPSPRTVRYGCNRGRSCGADGAGRLVADRISRLPQTEWMYGSPNASIVMAAFLHVAPGGMRFNGPDRGAWYAAGDIPTAAAEVGHHLRRETVARNVTTMTRTYSAYAVGPNPNAWPAF